MFFVCNSANKIKTKDGFTLSEVMIVLVIIGLLTAVLMPIMFNSKPDEKILKFKKGHEILYNTINELVTSDKYYCNGDLGIKADCRTKVNNDEDTASYFCETMAELMPAKEVSCYVYNTVRTGTSNRLLSNEYISYIATGSPMQRTVTPETIQATKIFFDTTCKESGKTFGAEITTVDGLVFYQSGKGQFATHTVSPNEYNGLTETVYLRHHSPPGQFPANYSDQNGFDISYKIYCMDIDGIPDNVTQTDCVNECPFGYGIRADGKILTGAKADEWLSKSIKQGND